MDSEAPKRVYGTYTVVRAARNPATGEWTNIGVIVFNENGDRVYARMGFDRAIARGDISPEVAARMGEYFKCYDHVDQVHRALESLGHMMSSIQVRGPLKTMMRESHDDLFGYFVLGEKEE